MAGGQVDYFAYFFSGSQLVLVLLYLKPVELFRLSFDSSSVRYHLSSFLLDFTAEKGTITSFSPAPRKPPTPMTRPVILPDWSTSTSSTSPNKQNNRTKTENK